MEKITIIDEELKNKLLAHYSGEERERVNNQIEHMNSFINEHIMEYKFSQDFRKATDLLLTDILNGKLK